MPQNYSRPTALMIDEGHSVCEPAEESGKSEAQATETRSPRLPAPSAIKKGHGKPFRRFAMTSILKRSGRPCVQENLSSLGSPNLQFFLQLLWGRKTVD